MHADLDTPENSTAQDWRRVSPLSVVDFFITLLRQGFVQALPALAVLVASAASSDRLELAFVLAGVSLLIVLIIVYGFLAYLRFGYQLTDRRINVRKGVLHRELLNIDQDRIQNVTIHEPFYFRPFKLAALSIDTAGSSGKEIRLPGIPLADARQLRNQLVDEADHNLEQTADTAIAGDGDEAGVLIRLSRKDVVIAGLTANFMLWAAIAIGTLFGSGETAEQAIGAGIDQLHVKEAVDRVRAEGGDVLAGLLALGGLVFLLGLLTLISVIGALLRYDGYVLSVNGDRFRRSSGLLSRHDESVRQHKIQAVTWKQNAIARLLGRINLQLRQASAGSGLESGDVSAGALKQTFPVPSLRPAQSESLTARFLPGYKTGQHEFTRVDLRRYLTVGPLIMLTPIGVGLSLLGFFVDWRFAAAWVPLAIAVWSIHYLCWRQTGWAVNGKHALLKTGFIGSTTSVFPLFKVQRVDVTQTNGMRKRGLAHLTVHLASHSTTLPWMDADAAFRFRDLSIFEAESSRDAWF